MPTNMIQRNTCLPYIFVLLLLASCGQEEKKAPITHVAKIPKDTVSKVATTDSLYDTERGKQLAKLPTVNKEATITKKNPEKRKQPKTKLPAKKKETAKRNKHKKTKSYAQAAFKIQQYSFDTITAGDIVNYQFEFMNIGNKPLQILEATASCGCTTPVVPFLDIPPGSKHKISVSYNSLNKEGDEQPTIKVVTNGKPKVYTLRLKGYVKPQEKK